MCWRGEGEGEKKKRKIKYLGHIYSVCEKSKVPSRWECCWRGGSCNDFDANRKLWREAFESSLLVVNAKWCKICKWECVVLVFPKIGLRFCDGETASCVLTTIHIKIDHLTRLYNRHFYHFSGPSRHENKWSCPWQLSRTNCSPGMHTLCARRFMFCCEQLLWSKRTHIASFLPPLQPWLTGKQFMSDFPVCSF